MLLCYCSPFLLLRNADDNLLSFDVWLIFFFFFVLCIANSDNDSFVMDIDCVLFRVVFVYIYLCLVAYCGDCVLALQWTGAKSIALMVCSLI